MITYQVTTYNMGFLLDGSYGRIVDEVYTYNHASTLTRNLLAFARQGLMFDVESYQEDEPDNRESEWVRAGYYSDDDNIPF